MKKFLLKIGLLTLMVVCADVVIGHGLEYVTSHIKVGGQGRDNYIADKANEDILVFGSSRAVHHYNSALLEDSLEMTCYNCGDDGNGIILSYARLLMVKERHSPQIIIIDVASGFDLMINDNHKYLGWLKAHYDKDSISSIFDDVDNTEKYKMMSYLYRYNSRFLQNIFVYLTGKSNDGGIKGFRPLKGNLNKMKFRVQKDETESYTYDSLKLKYVNKFIDLADGTELFFVVSPIWYGMDSLQLQPLKVICKERSIPFIDFSNNKKYVHQNKYFKDGTHMNAIGADEFTKDLVGYIKKYKKGTIYDLN